MTLEAGSVGRNPPVLGAGCGAGTEPGPGTGTGGGRGRLRRASNSSFRRLMVAASLELLAVQALASSTLVLWGRYRGPCGWLLRDPCTSLSGIHGLTTYRCGHSAQPGRSPAQPPVAFAASPWTL